MHIHLPSVWNQQTNGKRHQSDHRVIEWGCQQLVLLSITTIQDAEDFTPFPHIFFAPDPSIIENNGVHVVLTSVEITQQLADSKFTMMVLPSDMKYFMRVSRRRRMQLYEQFSLLSGYFKDINGCIGVNPGRMVNVYIEATITRIIAKGRLEVHQQLQPTPPTCCMFPLRPTKAVNLSSLSTWRRPAKGQKR